MLSAERLDWELFNVAELVASGYTDDETKELPVIVQYDEPTATRVMTTQVEALLGSEPEATLESIDAVAVDVDKEEAGSFWSAVSNSAASTRGGAASTTLDRGLERIWLDRKVEVDLDESVPQVGAPQAWAAGYDGSGVTVAVLDTGIDPAHPDVAGRIAASENFTTDASVVDGNGHGTHVASTIAGFGAASHGRYTGIAPGSKLLVGKVLRDSGSGPTSGVIEGMEWAAEQGAEVVNMSLGGGSSDGSDPLSQAVNELSAEHDTLFVISAGNDGPSAQTVGSPGAADAALTVGAVDKSEQLAEFSSRGPRFGDRGLKPDIAAPGVDIVAARAASTSRGTPVDEYYTALSGTSMAAPHVAGAAAILAQQRPDWTGQQLKDALTSTAKDLGYTAYEQGTGRLDVARAVDQGVYADGGVAFGRLTFPQTAPVTRTITYTNLTDAAVSLHLTAALSTFDGEPAPDGMFTLGRDELTVPAHSTAQVAVTLDPAAGDAGAHQGVVRAFDSTGMIQVTSTVGAYLEPESLDLTLEVTPPDGASEVDVGSWLIVRMDGRVDLDEGPVTLPAAAQATARLPKGVYTVVTGVTWRDAAGERNYALPTDPQLDLDEDTTVQLDLRQAERITVQTPKETESYDAWFGHQRVDAGNTRQVTAELQADYGEHNYWALPTDTVTAGAFSFYSQHLLGAPPITMKAVGGGPSVELHPRYQTPGISVLRGGPPIPKLDGRGRPASLVYAGYGLAEDFEGIDADGALVLLTPTDVCATTCSGQAVDRVQNAAAAGAAGVLISGEEGRGSLGEHDYPLPTMSLAAHEVTTLIDRLEHRPVRIRYTAQAETPYVYALRFTTDDKVPADLAHVVRDSDLFQIDNRFHADQPGQVDMERSATRIFPYGEDSVDADPTGSMSLLTKAQRRLVEYVGPVSDDLVWVRNSNLTYDAPSSVSLAERQGGSESGELFAVFPDSGHRVEHWYAQPWVPGVQEVGTASWMMTPRAFRFCTLCRSGGTLLPIFYSGSSEPAHIRDLTILSDSLESAEEVSLHRNGQEIPLEFRWATFLIFSFRIPAFSMPADAGTYRLVHRYRGDQWRYPMQLHSTEVRTAWEFTSRRPTGGPPTSHVCVPTLLTGEAVEPDSACRPEPLLFLRYDLGLDLDNTLPAGRSHTVTITGYHNQLVSPEPEVADLELEVSFDDGETWEQVATRSSGGSDFTARIRHPKLGDTTGAVGLRVRAEDADGNTVEQTIERAYGLK